MFLRVLAAIVLIVIGAGLLVVGWPALFGLQTTMGFAQLVSLRGLAIAGAIVGMIIFAALALVSRPLRKFCSSVALLFLLFGLVSVTVLAVRGFGGPAPGTAAVSGDLRVLSWNTHGDAQNAVAIAALALETKADIVSLPETTKATATAVAQLMAADGKAMRVHTVAFDQVYKARSTSLLISAALGNYSINSAEGSTSVLPSLVATPDNGRGPTIIAVHAVAPITSKMVQWRSDLNWLKSACGNGNVIMAGDFNSTVDHFSGLATSAGTTVGACTDVAMLSGSGAVGTWPTFLPALLGAPIDHVMVTQNWRVIGMQVIQSRDKASSDHRPILVQLAPIR
jgi:endonuclease/exonuclease/phosphatase (EEP) superfamily protein YafD